MNREKFYSAVLFGFGEANAENQTWPKFMKLSLRVGVCPLCGRMLSRVAVIEFENRPSVRKARGIFRSTRVSRVLLLVSL